MGKKLNNILEIRDLNRETKRDIYSKDFEEYMKDTIEYLQKFIGSKEFRDTVARSTGLKRKEKSIIVKDELANKRYDFRDKSKRLYQVAILADAINNMAHIYDIEKDNRAESHPIMLDRMFDVRSDLMECKDELLLTMACHYARSGQKDGFSYVQDRRGKEAIEVSMPNGKVCSWHLGTERNREIFISKHEKAVKAMGLEFEMNERPGIARRSNYEFLRKKTFDIER